MIPVEKFKHLRWAAGMIFFQLRVFRLARVWKTLRILVQTMMASFPSILNMSVVTFIVIFTLALFGMHALDSQIANDPR